MFGLRKKYQPSEEQFASVNGRIAKVREAGSKEEVLDLVVAEISNQAQAQIVIDRGIDRLKELGMTVQEAAEAMFGKEGEE